MPIDFGLGDDAEEFGAQVQAFLAEHLPAEHGCSVRDGWDGHHQSSTEPLPTKVWRSHPWPGEFGGQDKNPYEMTAMLRELYEAGVSLHPIANARMAGETLLKFATTELLDEVMPRLCGGEVIICLGYTEPESGSDVAAAKTRAVREGDEWLINGRRCSPAALISVSTYSCSPAPIRSSEAPRPYHVSGAARHPWHRDSTDLYPQR